MASQRTGHPQKIPNFPEGNSNGIGKAPVLEVEEEVKRDSDLNGSVTEWS